MSDGTVQFVVGALVVSSLSWPVACYFFAKLIITERAVIFERQDETDQIRRVK